MQRGKAVANAPRKSAMRRCVSNEVWAIMPLPQGQRWGIPTLEEGQWSAVTRPSRITTCLTVGRDNNTFDLLEWPYCIPFMANSPWTSGYSHVFSYKIFYLPEDRVSLICFNSIVSWALRGILNLSICLDKPVYLFLRRKTIMNKLSCFGLFAFTNCIGFCRCTFRRSLN